MYILDQENPTLPATPEDETASSLYGRKNPNFSSGSSENLGRESQGNTPSSPSKNQKFFERSGSGPGSGPGSSDSGLDNSRKCKSSTSSNVLLISTPGTQTRYFQAHKDPKVH